MGFRLGIRIPLPGPFSLTASAPANLSGWRMRPCDRCPRSAALQARWIDYERKMAAWRAECARIDAERGVTR